MDPSLYPTASILESLGLGLITVTSTFFLVSTTRVPCFTFFRRSHTVTSATLATAAVSLLRNAAPPRPDPTILQMPEQR